MKSVTYRAHAQQCLEMAEMLSSHEAKNTLFSMAQCWHRLAQEAEEQEHRDVVWEPEPPSGTPEPTN